MSTALLEIEARGSAREIGRQIGEAARELIAAGIAYYEEFHESMSGLAFAEAELRSAAYLAPARRHLPLVVEQLEGMAEGARVALSKLMVPNLGEELGCPGDHSSSASRAHAAGPEHCTSVAVVARGRCLLGHNEDWWAGDADKNVLLRLAGEDGTQVLAITAACLLPCMGINSHGVATCGNTVNSDDAGLGVPNSFIRRDMLEARSVADARKRALLPERARGSSHVLADAKGSIWDVETSATSFATIVANDRFAHTNHYLTPAMAFYGAGGSEGSRARLARAVGLLDAGMARGDDPRELLGSILSDHDGIDDAASICCHADPSSPTATQQVTTASVIWHLDDLEAEVCAGPPCENGRRRYRL